MAAASPLLWAGAAVRPPSFSQFSHSSTLAHALLCTLCPPHAGNLFGGNVNHRVIMSIMTGMADRSRTVDGVPTSLKDLGYTDVGLDGAWGGATARGCPCSSH